MIKFLFWFALFIGLVCYSFYKYNQIDLYRKHRRQHEDVDRTVSMTFENFEKLFSLFLNEFEYVSDEVKEGYLCALISKVLEKLTLKKETADSSNILKSVIKYCKENYEKDISLEKMAEELNVSKFYLSHIFSDKINISFKEGTTL